MINLRDLPPSERAEEKAKADAELKALEKSRIAMMREDFGRTFQTEHGKRVLAWLFERCGYGKSKLGASASGTIDEKLTVHNAMEESLYIAVRKFISVDVLQQVEYGFVKPSGTIDGSEAVNTKAKKGKKK